jgi:hypothetical protein
MVVKAPPPVVVKAVLPEFAVANPG